MKTIMLLRHAESSHAGPGVKDFDRSLAEKGQQDAPRLGTFIRQANTMPGYIESSPAKRARQTTELLIDTAGIDSAKVHWNKDLYYGGARDYLSVIQHAPEEIDHILLIGHNPLLEETVSIFCNGEGRYTARMPTGALVCIEHPAIKWEQVKAGTARFQWMMIPKILNNLS
ncbi:SixA phosphatase family protein [Fodinibius halophilus]|nr:histidine phosphatase family protein [Fodinibius halophilus]